ncbi:MAG: hypothetical protein WBI17_02840 [Clostridiaceae bacterium]
METKQFYYSKMKKKLSMIQSSNYEDEANRLILEYIGVDAELRKFYNCDDADDPNLLLDEIQDKIEDRIKSFDENLTTIRNSIDSGNKEYNEDTLDEYNLRWSVLVMRSSAINLLIIHRNNIDKKYWA